MSLNLFLASLIDVSKSSGVSLIRPPLKDRSWSQLTFCSSESLSSRSIAIVIVLSTIDTKSLAVNPALCSANVSRETSGLSTTGVLSLVFISSSRSVKINFRSGSVGTLILMSNLNFDLISSEMASASLVDPIKMAPLDVYSSINSASLSDIESFCC
ncbi:hypothetical protein OGATHE_002543 [Ogataea polymorpha]|uniref:Uncharacterized protein n=1 Tax=Ogataea polymorpha TaxID=460523 RepID=A0A9P8PDC2_9ASCO|nr:hypothetical protein OGATHE_002543 [Ogataea polymorpha]